MLMTADPSAHGRARLSFADEAEIDEFVATLRRFERGEIGPDAWRAYRLVRGTYSQRQPGDVQMLRVKVPQGVLTGAQLEAFADVGERWSRGFGHITTRQNVQFHFVALGDVEAAIRRLADAGLTTREACGNSVRNVTACVYAGVAADEPFDVTPYAEALTRYCLRHPLSSTLPRKFKIAFEGCGTDHVATAINDIGFRACARDEGGRERRGFRVTVAGGTSTLCAAGHLLAEFLPAGDILAAAEAVLRVFHRLGDREHKQRNRMKFLVRALGWARWRDEFEQALAAVRAEGAPALPFEPDAAPEETAPDWPRPAPPAVGDVARRAAAAVLRGPGLRPVATTPGPPDPWLTRWLRTNVRPQKQFGYVLATVTVPLGDLTSAQMRILADLARAYGDGAVRLTTAQNVALRWVRRADARELYRRLAAAGLGAADADSVADVTSCPGAESCRLAVTQSRGLARLLSDQLRARSDLVAAASNLSIKISGCPNGCGQHHVAGLGFQGSVRKVGGRPAPYYFVMVGGGIAGDDTRFARLAAKIPARRAPAAVERLVALYLAERAESESAAAFFQRVEIARVKAALADLEALSPETAAPEDFIDLGDQAEFVPDVQEGECSA